VKHEEINISRHENDENNAEFQLNGGQRRKHQKNLVFCSVAKTIFLIDLLEKNRQKLRMNNDHANKLVFLLKQKTSLSFRRLCRRLP